MIPSALRTNQDSDSNLLLVTFVYLTFDGLLGPCSLLVAVALSGDWGGTFRSDILKNTV